MTLFKSFICASAGGHHNVLHRGPKNAKTSLVASTLPLDLAWSFDKARGESKNYTELKTKTICFK